MEEAPRTMSHPTQEYQGLKEAMSTFLWQSSSMLRSLQSLSLSARGYRAAWLSPPTAAVLPAEAPIPSDWPVRLISNLSRIDGLEMLLNVQLGVSHVLLQLEPIKDTTDLLTRRRRRRLETLREGFETCESVSNLRQAKYVHDELAILLKLYLAADPARGDNEKLLRELRKGTERLSTLSERLGPFNDQWEVSKSREGSVADLAHSLAKGRLFAEGASAKLWLALQEIVKSGRRADEKPGREEACALLDSLTRIRRDVQDLEELMQQLASQAEELIEPRLVVGPKICLRSNPSGKDTQSLVSEVAYKEEAMEGLLTRNKGVVEDYLEVSVVVQPEELAPAPRVPEVMVNAEQVYMATGGTEVPVDVSRMNAAGESNCRLLSPDSLPELQNVLRERSKACVQTHHKLHTEEPCDVKPVLEEARLEEETFEGREAEWRGISALLLARAPCNSENEEYFE